MFVSQIPVDIYPCLQNDTTRTSGAKKSSRFGKTLRVITPKKTYIYDGNCFFNRFFVVLQINEIELFCFIIVGTHFVYGLVMCILLEIPLNGKFFYGVDII